MNELKHFESLYPPQTREKEIRQLIPFVEKGLSVQLVGLPGSGKSNILRLLCYNKGVRTHTFGEYEKFLHFVYIDCSEIKNRPMQDIIKFIIISLSFSLGERGLIDESKRINDFLKEGLEVPDEMFLFQSLKKSLDFLSIEKKLTIYILFDKFDSILPQLTSQFFTNLRILRNQAKYRFGSVFSLTRPLEDVVDPMLLADYHDLISGNIIYTTLHDEVGMEFRLDYIDKAARKQVLPEIRKRIIELCGGHAQLTKLSYEALVSEDNNPEKLEEFLLKRIPVLGTLYAIWNALLPEEQLAIKHYLLFDEIKEKFPYLANVFLLDEKGLTIPLFSSYIKSVPVESKEKITYSKEHNDILLGESSLLEKLSPSEFKLLKFLIENKERLVTKDEIIETVWGGQKSYEGVTDQALDQIFYRLRKKIEQDPTTPRYIHTIKGKGYKLSD